MLEGLDHIDWASLRHAYGPATDAPEHLRRLASDDPGQREEAYTALMSSLCHQGDVYQATPHVVPFLFEMLAADAVPDRALLLWMLAALSAGQPWLTPQHTWMVEVLAGQGRDFEDEVRLARQVADQTHQAVRAGLSLILSLLDHADRAVRIGAARVLCTLPEDGLLGLAALRARIEREPDVAVRAELVNCLGDLAAMAAPLPAEEHAACGRLLEALVGSPHQARPVRFAAARALAHLAGPQVAPGAVEVLLDVVIQPQGLAAGRDDPSGPALDPDQERITERIAVSDACRAIAQLGAERAIPALVEGLRRVSAAEGAHQLAVLLLDFAFTGRGREATYTGLPAFEENYIYYGVTHPRPADGVEERQYPQAQQPRDPRTLSERQRQAVRAVLDCPAVWHIRSNLLEIHGLMGPPDALRAALDAAL